MRYKDVRVNPSYVRARLEDKRLIAPLDLIMLTDAEGRILDMALPGRPSCVAFQRGEEKPAARDEVMFPRPAKTSGALFLFGLFSGAAAPCAELAPLRDAKSFISRVNLPFLAASPAPACTPPEALALGVAPEKVVEAVYQDILGRPGGAEDCAAHAKPLTTRERDIQETMFAIARSNEAFEHVLGVRKAPERSKLRSRALYLEVAQAPELGVASNIEGAFTRLGLAFDPALWRRAPLEAALKDAQGDVCAFARRVDPLRLIAPLPAASQEKTGAA